MSDATAEYAIRLNLADIVARIEWSDAEMHKFVAEQAKLTAEQSKLLAEQNKLSAEALKLRRDRFVAPALALPAALGAIATFAPAIVRTIGGHG